MAVLYCCWRSSSALLTETPVSNTRQSHFKRNKREEVKKFYLQQLQWKQPHPLQRNQKGGEQTCGRPTKTGELKRRKEKTNKKDPEGNYTGVHINQKEGKEKNNCRGAQQTRTHNSRRTRWKPTPLGAGPPPFLSLFIAPLHQPENEREKKKTITIISHVFTLYAVSARPRNSSEL